MDAFRAIDRKLKGHNLRSCSFFVKNRQDMKKLLNKIAAIVYLKISLQLFIFSIMSISLAQ